MSAIRDLSVVAALLLSSNALAADIPLYPTGPAEDSAFIRFINGSSEPVQVIAQEGQPPLKLDTQKPASQFFAVQASNDIKGSLVSGAQHVPLLLKVEPGEFASVVALSDGKGGVKTVTVHDIPDDFNGLKASLGFFNLDVTCADAVLRPAGRNADLFKGVAEGGLQRRSINPVQLSVQLVCGGANVGAALDLGELKAGERYSVLLLPSASGPRLLFATDLLSH
ncbi:cell division protein FtsQ [Pseudomonas sp. Pseusp122]|uniref:cell division protein FtsQ n=1 Tax=unclassified Pseudomonas TaxID=196821 RepID=UPI0039A539DE